MEYYSCSALQSFQLVFNGDLDKANLMACCCEPLKNIPGCSIKDLKAGEVLDSFLKMRETIIETSKKFAAENPDSDEKPDISGCKDCVQFKKANWGTKNEITRVNFSMYPSPCQCKCIYCNVNKGKFELTEVIKEQYEKVFEVVDEAINRGLISSDTKFQVSCGEITIHPYKDRIYEYVKDKSAVFYTNCFKYDEHIAECLHNFSDSAINLSIDAGLSDTWQKVKGFNNFEKIIDNLVQYHNATQVPEQIRLKYIVMPGVNTTEEDFLNLISIMNSLKIPRLEISRDAHFKYNLSDDKTELMYSVAYLVVLCMLHGIQCSFFEFSEEEQIMILKISKLITEDFKNNN